MNEYLRPLLGLLARLNPREQRLVVVFLALLAVVVVYGVIVEPLVGGRRRLASDIESLSGDVAVMETLADRIHALETIGAKKRKGPAGPAEDFSLFAFIDKAAVGSVREETVASMTPTRRPLEQGMEESTVELKLSAVTLAEIVALLREIEGARHPVYVKRLDMKKRYDERREFDVVLIAGAMSRT